MLIDKRKKSAIAIYAIVAIVFVILTLVIPFDKPAASWVMFAFSLLSVALGAGITIYAFERPEKLMSKFYGYPMFKVGYIYTVAQLALTFLIYLIGAFVQTPYWVGVVLSIIPLGFVGIGCIAAENIRDYIEEIDTRTIITTGTFKRFNIDVADILDACDNPEVYEPMKKLNEKFKYSDPVSSPATEEKEEEIKREIEKLKNIINNESTENVIDEIKLISNLLSSRNRICEARK